MRKSCSGRGARGLDETPASANARGEAAPRDAGARESRPGRRASVLIVDDDPVLVESLRELLNEEGYDAEGFTDARLALEFLRKGPLPSVVLLDYVMPTMSGDQFLDALDAAGLAPSVVLFTAMHESAVRPPGDRVAGIVRKPFDIEPLLETIARVAGA